MTEGAWIHAATGAHATIDDHARWIHRRANAASLGLPEEVLADLESISPDHDGPGRHALLRRAMDAGLIRFRGHGSYCTLEGTLPWLAILQGAAPFLASVAGEQLMVHIHDLAREEAMRAPWWLIQHYLELHAPQELQGLVEPCRIRRPALWAAGRSLRRLKGLTGEKPTDPGDSGR